MKKRVQLSVMIVASTVLCACGGGGGGGSTSSPDAIQEGYLVDSAVTGVQYSTQTLGGITGENGKFQYRDGEEVVFSLGVLQLGSASAKGIITPVDIAPDGASARSPDVVNRLRLLQGLDSDGDPDNGITIDSGARAGMKLEYARWIDLDTDDAFFDNQRGIAEFLTEQGYSLPTRESAMEHFENTQAALEDPSGEWLSNFDAFTIEHGYSNFCQSLKSDISAEWSSVSSSAASSTIVKQAGSLWLKDHDFPADIRLMYDDPELGFELEAKNDHIYTSKTVSTTRHVVDDDYVEVGFDIGYRIIGSGMAHIKLGLGVSLQDSQGNQQDYCEYEASGEAQRI